MLIQVQLKERINEFDFRNWSVQVPCGNGGQCLRWLGYAACAHMAFLTGDVPAKYVPQAVRNLDGKALDVEKQIKEIFEDGASVEIECARGPQAFTVVWDGRPPLPAIPFEAVENPVKKIEEEITELPAEPASDSGAAAEGIPPVEAGVAGTVPPAESTESVPLVEPAEAVVVDQREEWASEVLKSVGWENYKIPGLPAISKEDGHDLPDELVALNAVLRKHCGTLQCLFLWYSAQGEELEDQDFYVLNIEQFLQVFYDSKLNEFITDDVLKCCFDNAISSKGYQGVYQISLEDFIPSIVFLASGIGNTAGDSLCEKVIYMIEGFLIPSLTEQLSPELEDLRSVSTEPAMLEMLKERKDLFKACFMTCNSKADTNGKLKVEFKILLPHLKKWLVLGPHWSSRSAASLIIYAYKDPLDENGFPTLPPNLRISPKKLRKFVLGASHHIHKTSTSLINISEQAYVQQYVDQVFVRAGVAKPPYSNYEEKKAYLRSICIRHGAVPVTLAVPK